MSSMFCWSYGTTQRDQNWGTFLWPQTIIGIGIEPIGNEKENNKWDQPFRVPNYPYK